MIFINKCDENKKNKCDRQYKTKNSDLLYYTHLLMYYRFILLILLDLQMTNTTSLVLSAVKMCFMFGIDLGLVISDK